MMEEPDQKIIETRTATELSMQYVEWFGKKYGSCEPMHNEPGQHPLDLAVRDERRARRRARMRRRQKRGRWGT